MELTRWASETRPRMDAAEWARTARTLVLLLVPLARRPGSSTSRTGCSTC